MWHNTFLGLFQTPISHYCLAWNARLALSPSVGQIRLLVITLCFSSFVSDTAVTAIMIPIVIAYCQKARLPLKQFMSILGFAALTGGTNTVIGTSTNLVISGRRSCHL